MKKGIIKKEQEVDRLLKSMIDESSNADGMITHTQFIKCFTRVILKASIINIYYYANHQGKIGDEEVPPTLKVLKF